MQLAQLGRAAILTQRGFTLIEMVAVLIMLGILSAVAFPRFAGISSYRDRVFQETLLTSLRLSQRTALSHNASTIEWRLNRPGTESWRYAIDIDSAEQVGETQASNHAVTYTASLAAGGFIAGTLNLNNTLTLRYDSSGNLIWAGNGTVSGTLSSSMRLDANGRLLCISLTGFAYDGACR